MKLTEGDKVKVRDWSYSFGLTQHPLPYGKYVYTVIRADLYPVKCSSSPNGFELDTAIADDSGNHWFVCSKGLTKVETEKDRLLKAIKELNAQADYLASQSRALNARANETYAKINNMQRCMAAL